MSTITNIAAPQLPVAKFAQDLFPDEFLFFKILGLQIFDKLYGPGLSLAENGAAPAGTVHANCAGQPGSLDAFLHSDVEL
jgi:hypothetical protein